MNKRFLSVLAFALLVSAGASYLVYRMIGRRVGSAPAPVTSRVVVATRSLPVGTLIRDPDVRLADWMGPVPAHALLKTEEVIGRGVVATIYETEPILDSRLAPRGAGAGMAATIPPGMRAVAVRVNEVVGVAGFVVPGMRVDVLISGNPPGAAQAIGTQTRTILQNIEVLSAGQNIQKDAEGKPVTVPVVNLLVTPEQAEVLSLASNEARIQLVLRNPLDTKEAKTPGTAISYLFGGQRAGAPARAGARPARAAVKATPPAAVKETPPPPLLVEVLHGATKTEVKFPVAAERKR
ncbi:MAG: Flp pilus assembly protein CpaB [Acidobacteriota bacterium]